jgi:ComF family protein
MRPESGSVCSRCGDSLLEPGGTHDSRTCRTCRLVPPPFTRTVAYGLYQQRLRDAIHVLKYDGVPSAAQGLGRLLSEAIAKLDGEAPAQMLVVPVPLHGSKHAERGFNQARLLACEALRILKKSHRAWQLTLAPGTLMRLRMTKSQAGLTSRQRRMNVRGAFSVSEPGLVAGKHILLIDDIMTTGATARAAANALLRAGAETVWVATLARARRISAETPIPSFEDDGDFKGRTGEPAVPMQGASFGMNSSAGQPS